MKPRRIQRKRTKGWKMPPNTVYVGRPTGWGNPFVKTIDFTREKAVAEYRRLIECDPGTIAAAIKQLRGKDLACWCPLVDKDGRPVPCHADVLLEIANSERAVPSEISMVCQ